MAVDTSSARLQVQRRWALLSDLPGRQGHLAKSGILGARYLLDDVFLSVMRPRLVSNS